MKPRLLAVAFQLDCASTFTEVVAGSGISSLLDLLGRGKEEDWKCTGSSKSTVWQLHLCDLLDIHSYLSVCHPEKDLSLSPFARCDTFDLKLCLTFVACRVSARLSTSAHFCETCENA